MKRFFFLSSIAIFFFLAPLGVFGLFDKIEESVLVSEDEIVKGDIIKISDVIDITGNVEGDVIVLGGSVKIKGVVGGDVIAAGSNIKVLGQVHGNVRVAGGNVEIQGIVGKNANVLAGNLFLLKDSQILGNAYLAGGLIQVEGNIAKDLVVRGGQVYISGQIQGNTNVTLQGKSFLFVKKPAHLEGKLIYEAGQQDQASIEEGVIVGEKHFEKIVAPDRAKNFLAGVYTFSRLVSLFGMLVLGLLFVSLFPRWVMHIQEDMTAHPYLNILRGFIVFALTPIIVIFLLLTIIGIPLALIALPLYFVAVYFSKVIAGIAIGIFITQKFNKTHEVSSLIFPMILGVVTFAIVTNISYIGWIFNLIAIFWALGAFYEMKKQEIMKWR